MLGAALIGCGLGDPLEKVRGSQDTDGNYAATVEPLRELLEDRPDDPEVNYRYGLALAATGQPEVAKWSLRKAMESDEWFERSAATLSRALLSSGEHDESVEVCTRLLERKPDDIPTLLVRAQAYVGSRRNYEAGLADAERVLEIDPDNVEAQIPRTVALLGLERVEEANEALEQLEGLYRDDSLGLHGSAGFCTARATFAREKGDHDLAAERYDACLEAFPEWEPLVQDAVGFFDALGRRDHAQQILERALAAGPTNRDFRANLAMRLHGQGETERALEVMRDGTRDLGGSPADTANGWGALGSFLLDLGNFEQAAEAFRRAMELDPTGSPELLFAAADAAVVAGRYDDALRLAELMSVPAHRELVQGRVALSRREPRKALDHFEKGIRLWPNNAFARYYAAVAAEQVGDFARAIEEYRYAMRVDPTATDAYLRLARLHAAAGRDSHALTALAFMPGGRPEEDQARRLEMRILARLGRAPDAPKRPAENPEPWVSAVAEIARGIRDRDGAAAAVTYLRRVDSIDFGDRANAEIAEVWTESLAASGRAEEAIAKIDAALRKHPEVAFLHALRGNALRLARADPARARDAYDKALALDADEPRALRGLADLEAAQGANDKALALYDRARAAAPDSAASSAIERSAATVLSAAGRVDEADERLHALLREHPYDAGAALILAEHYAARGADPAQTRLLAQRAVEFRGGPEAKAFLRKLGTAGDPLPAAGASKGQEKAN